LREGSSVTAAAWVSLIYVERRLRAAPTLEVAWIERARNADPKLVFYIGIGRALAAASGTLEPPRFR